MIQRKPGKKSRNWTSIFTREANGFSSKRILAFIGFITCVIVFIIAFITGKEVPDFGETLLICCVSFYGVEMGSSWFSKSINKS